VFINDDLFASDRTEARTQRSQASRLLRRMSSLAKPKGWPACHLPLVCPIVQTMPGNPFTIPKLICCSGSDRYDRPEPPGNAL